MSATRDLPLSVIKLPQLIEQGLTSPKTQYRLSGRQFYRSKDPTNSIKVLKEKRDESKENPEKANKIQQHNKETHVQKHSKSAGLQ